MSAFIAARFGHAVRPALTGVTQEGRVANAGGLGWTPATFWAATLAEFELAVAEPSAAASVTHHQARAAAVAAGFTLFGE